MIEIRRVLWFVRITRSVTFAKADQHVWRRQVMQRILCTNAQIPIQIPIPVMIHLRIERPQLLVILQWISDARAQYSVIDAQSFLCCYRIKIETLALTPEPMLLFFEHKPTAAKQQAGM